MGRRGFAQHVEYGAPGALIAALVLLAPELRKRKVKMLEATTVIFFGAMTIAGIIVSPHDGEWLDRWANTISSGVLGVLVLVTLPFRPFTEAHAREQTPPEIWNTPQFRRTNQVITLVWGGVFVGTAILGAIAASSPSSSDWTNWILRDRADHRWLRVHRALPGGGPRASSPPGCQIARGCSRAPAAGRCGMSSGPRYGACTISSLMPSGS